MLEKIFYKDRIFDIKNKTSIMGILNITPDSFSDGGKFFNYDAAIQQAKKIEKENGVILDIGAETTNPKATPIAADEEIKRLSPILKEIIDFVNIPVSVDTYKSETAEFALKTGAYMINDIYGLTYDKKIANVVARYGATICINHFHRQEFSKNVIEDINFSFDRAIKLCIDAGIDENKIILDPGVGFGKTVDENWNIISNLKVFKKFNLPLLLGTSKKSLFNKLNFSTPDERGMATVATSIIACKESYEFVRVHNVKENFEALKVANYVYRGYLE